MGQDEFDLFPDLVRKADAILGYSIKELCLTDPHQHLGKTEFTQPALFVTNAFAYLRRLKEGQSPPDYVIGHSLGEYCALFAAGAITFEAGLELVRERGRIMSEAVGGGMSAVIGLSEDKIRAVLDGNGLSGVDIANSILLSRSFLQAQKRRSCKPRNSVKPRERESAFPCR